MADNSFTELFLDGTALTQAQLESAFKSLQLNIANTALMGSGSTAGNILTSNGDNVAASFQAIPDPLGPSSIRNYGLLASATGGVLRVILKTHAGADPTGADKVDFVVSNNGSTSGTYSALTVNAATSISVNASATLGLTTTSAIRVYVYGYYNTAASAVKLAVSTRSNYDAGVAVAMTALSASADKSDLYATAALSVIPRLLGHVVTAHNAAGAWQSSTKVNVVNNQIDTFDNGRRVAATTPTTGYGQVALSPTCGSFTSSAGTFVAVTNLSVTIETTGRPVFVGLVSDVAAAQCLIGGVRLTSGTSMNVDFYIVQDSVNISRYGIAAVSGAAAIGVQSTVPGSSLWAIGFPTAGTHTYEIQTNQTSTGTRSLCQFAKLVAYEI